MRCLLSLVLAFAPTASHAALVGRVPATPNGTDYQAYYDNVLDITWLANANLAATNSFGVSGIGVSDPNPAGHVDWNTAKSWIAGMNAANYLGVNEWRLPIIVDTGTVGCNYASSGTDCGYNVQTKSAPVNSYQAGQTVYSEMAHLYYVTLGNPAAFPATGGVLPCWGYVPNGCLANSGPFSNIQTIFGYWSGTETSWQISLAPNLIPRLSSVFSAVASITSLSNLIFSTLGPSPPAIL